MNLTEEKAKEILDFLARRIGCLRTEIQMLKNISFINCIFIDIWQNTRKSALVYDNLFGDFVRSDVPSYKSLLEDMIKESRNGHLVKAYGFSRPFLDVNADIYAILIEMDLKNESI